MTSLNEHKAELSFARKKKICLTVTAIITFIFTALQSAAMLLSYEPERFSFSHGSVLGVLCNICLAVGAAFALFTAFFMKSNELSLSLAPTGNISSFSAALSGGMTVFSSVMRLINRTPQNENLLTMLLILSLPTAIYLIISALSRKKSSAELSLLALCPVFFFALSLVITHYEIGGITHDPVRVLSQLTSISLMLYFLSELRARMNMMLTGWYFASGICAVISGIAYSVSMLIARAARPELVSAEGDTVTSLFILCICIYVAVRLFDLKPYIEPECSKTNSCNETSEEFGEEIDEEIGKEIGKEIGEEIGEE